MGFKLRESNLYLACELAGDWDWIDHGYSARVKGGQKLWETASLSRGGKTVRLWTLEDNLKNTYKYVSLDTEMELVKNQESDNRYV